MQLHGHGVRWRQVRGPSGPDGPPEICALLQRRYRCRACRAVIVVGPRGLVRGHLYSAAAMAWALALYGLRRCREAEVRRRVSPWSVVGSAALGSWATLRRWARAARCRRLFPQVRACPSDWTLRQVAERVATTLAALAGDADRSTPLDHQSWLGAAQLGRAIAM